MIDMGVDSEQTPKDGLRGGHETCGKADAWVSMSTIMGPLYNYATRMRLRLAAFLLRPEMAGWDDTILWI